MPSKNITIDNISPLINYQPVGVWSEGNSSDGLMSRYSGSTFTLCVDSGASATLTFNGTAIWLFGAKRGNHNLYNVTLDGKTTTSSGHATDPGDFQAPLYSATGLINMEHTVTLINAGTDPNRALDFLDLDFITWESTFGTNSEQTSDSAIQDSDAKFVYEPQSAWSTNPPNLNSFFGGSGHGTTTSGASATFKFAGSTVQIFGTTGPNNAPYSVSLDGGSPTVYNATKIANAAQVPIYYADNLGPGSHSVKIINQPALSGQGLNIDFAQVVAVPSVPTSIPTSKGLAGGAIAGIAIGAAAIIGILIGVFFFIRRRKVSRYTEKQNLFEPQHFSSVPPGQLQGGYGSSQALWNSPNHSGPHSESQGDGSSQYQPDYDHGVHQRTNTMGSSQPRTPYVVHNAISVAGSGSNQSSGHPHSESGDMSNSHPYSPTSDGDPFSGRERSNSRPHAYPPQKGAPVRLPSSASQTLAYIPPSELRANRMDVPGRPQDLGHLPVEGEIPPPNYSQATEPYDSQSRR